MASAVDSFVQHALKGAFSAASLDVGLAPSLPRTATLPDEQKEDMLLWSCGHALMTALLAVTIAVGLRAGEPLSDDDDNDGPQLRKSTSPLRVLSWWLGVFGGGRRASLLIVVLMVALGSLPLPGAALLAACATVRLFPAAAAVPTLAATALAKPYVSAYALSHHTAGTIVSRWAIDALQSFHERDPETGFIFSRAPLPLNVAIVALMLAVLGVLLIVNAMP